MDAEGILAPDVLWENGVIVQAMAVLVIKTVDFGIPI
jgi:hypothetical protein